MTRVLLIALALGGCDDGGGPGAVAPPDAAVDAAPDAAPDVAAPAQGDAPRFAFPIHPDDRMLIPRTPIFGVDHDPEPGERVRCTNYDGRGFPLCYDGHAGSDFILSGGFTTMDRGSARVVAAAGGVVLRIEDGHYDRCRADAQSAEVTCDGHPMIANRVELLHANGWESWYLHLATDSVVVAEGDVVRCGDVLGRVGSSGLSSLPHLHFHVVDPAGEPFDPFAGPFSQPESLWTLQSDVDGLPGPACDPVWASAAAAN